MLHAATSFLEDIFPGYGMELVLKFIKSLASNEQESHKPNGRETVFLVPAPAHLNMTAAPFPNEPLHHFSLRSISYMKNTFFGGKLADFGKCDTISLECLKVRKIHVFPSPSSTQYPTGYSSTTFSPDRI